MILGLITIVKSWVVAHTSIKVLAPSNCEQFMKTFEKQGMTTLHMWQVCNGILGAIHTP
jgi:hypothetical protein